MYTITIQTNRAGFARSAVPVEATAGLQATLEFLGLRVGNEELSRLERVARCWRPGADRPGASPAGAACRQWG